MLTERKKADRKIMADRIAEIARASGATARVEPGWPGPRAISVEIEAARGLTVAIDFDAESCQPDVFCLPWCVRDRSGARLADRFAASGYTVNPHHRRKSTQFAHGFTELCEMLQRGLTLAASGAAFEATEHEAGA